MSDAVRGGARDATITTTTTPHTAHRTSDQSHWEVTKTNGYRDRTGAAVEQAQKTFREIGYWMSVLPIDC